MSRSTSHPRKSRKRSLLALLGVASLVLAACGDDDDTDDEPPADDDVTEETPTEDDDAAPGDRGSITIGIANEVPFGYVGDDGEATGIAPDVARAVLTEMGYDQIDATVVEFGELIGGLQAGQFDLIAAGMYITPERAEQILFSDPDYCIAESLAVAEGNPLDIVDYQSAVDNPDITFAVASGTVEVGYAEDAGIPDGQLEVFGEIDSMYAALEAGEVDAVTGTAATVNRQVAARSGIEAVEPFFPRDADGEETLPCGGYGFRRDNQEFRDEFNDVLNQLQDDGTTMELITAYEDFDEADVENANELTVEDFVD